MTENSVVPGASAAASPSADLGGAAGGCLRTQHPAEGSDPGPSREADDPPRLAFAEQRGAEPRRATGGRAAAAQVDTAQFRRHAEPDSRSVLSYDQMLEARSAEIAEAVLALLTRGPQWRHRRVELLTPLSGSVVRRRVSLDLTVPAEYHEGLRLPAGALENDPSDHDQYVVPLAWLARRQLVSFDLRDAGGRSVPLLLGSQSAGVARDVILMSAVEAGLDPGPAADDVIEVVVAAAAEEMPEDPRGLVTRAASFGLGPDFVSLVQASSTGFLLLGVLSDISGRQVVKWQSDEVRPSSSGFELRLRMGGLREVASTHVELELPDVVQARSFDVWDDRQSRSDRDPADDSVPLPNTVRQTSPSPERPRLLLGPDPAALRPHVRADLTVSKAEFVAPAVVLSLLVLAMLVIGVATNIGEHVAGDNASGTASAAATVVLAAFAAMSGLVLRVETHPLVRSLLGRSRLALAITAGAVVVAAAPIGLQLDSDVIEIAWGAGVLMSLGAFSSIADTLYRYTH